MATGRLDHVNYSVLDQAKAAFIEAARRTTRFASRFGFIPGEKFGASANLFALDISAFTGRGAQQIFVSLVPEGLGTADDARPEDLSSAELTEFWYNIGIKTVSVLTNDAASSGLQTVLIGLYLPSCSPELVFTPEFMKGFLDGFVDGCERVGCVYLSGETPQLKTKIVHDKLDIAGSLFALLPAGVRPVGSDALAAGDQIVLIESSGPHENGFTSLRDLAGRLPQGYRTLLSDGTEYWRAINAPSRLYTPVIQQLLREGVSLTNVENITGHGWLKIMRPSQPFSYRISHFPRILPVFECVRQETGISYQELLQIFNCGSGMAVFVRTAADADRVVSTCAEHGLSAVHAGVVEDAAAREVVVESLGVRLGAELFDLQK